MATQDAILRLILDTQGVLKNLSVLVREWLQASSRMDRASNEIDFQAAKRETESLRALVDKSAAAIIVNLQRIDTEAKKSGGGFGAAEKAVIRLQQTAERELGKIERAAQRIELDKVRKEAKEAETAISKLTKIADTELKKVEKAADKISLRRAREEAKAAESAIKTLERSAANSFRALDRHAQATGQQLQAGIGGNLTRLSPQVQDLQRRFEASLNAMRNASDRITFERARSETQRLGAEIQKLGNQAHKDLDKIQQGSKKAGEGLSSLSNIAGRLRTALASLGIVISARVLLQLAQDAVSAGIRVQALEAQLEAAAGTQERYNQLLTFTHEISERLGFDFEVVTQATARFEAASRLAGISESERLNVIRSVIEASRVLQLSNQRIGNTLLALEQIASKGTVSMEELRRQLGDNIPGAVQILAREMGVTTEQLIKLIEQNKVLSSEALPALARGFDEAFGSGLQVALETTATSVGQLQKELLDLQVAFAEGFSDELRKAIRDTKKEIQDLQPSARDAGEAVAVVVQKTTQLAEALAKENRLVKEVGGEVAFFLRLLSLLGDEYVDSSGKVQRYSDDINTLTEDLESGLSKSVERLNSELSSLSSGQLDAAEKSESLRNATQLLIQSINLAQQTGSLQGDQLLELVSAAQALAGQYGDDVPSAITRLISELRSLLTETQRSKLATQEHAEAERALAEASLEAAEAFGKRRAAADEAAESLFGSRKELEATTQATVDAIRNMIEAGPVLEFTVEQLDEVKGELQELLDAWQLLGEEPPESLRTLAEELGVTTSVVEKELEKQTKAAEKAAKEQKKHFEEIQKSIKAIADEFIKLSDTLEGKTGVTEVEKLQEKLKDLQDQEFNLDIGEGEEFEKIRQQIEETREELQKAKKAQEEVGQAGSDMAEQIDDAIESIIGKIGPAFGELEFSGQQAIQSILQRLQNLGQLGDATSDDLAGAVRRIITEFEAAGLPVDDLRTALSELQTGTFDIESAFGALRKELGQSEDSLEGVRRRTEGIREENKKLSEEVAKGKRLWKEFADAAEQELPRAATAYDALLTRQERSIELCQMLKQCMGGVL